MDLDIGIPSGQRCPVTVYYDGARLRWANRRVHTPRVVFGEICYEPGGFCGPRIQRDYELVVLHSGGGRVAVDGIDHRLTVGVVFLFRPKGHEYFQFAEDRETHHSYCSVAPTFIPGDVRRRLDRAPLTVAQSEVFRLALTAAFRLRTPRTAASCQLIDQLGRTLLAEFLNAAEAEAHPVGCEPAVRSFLHFVEDHFGEEDCLAEAHRSTGVSRNTLIGRVRAELDTTPARYLWHYRAERGAAMLVETGHTVAEIAYRCGFKNPYHFSRMVKQILGQSPRTIRREAWGTPASPNRGPTLSPGPGTTPTPESDRSA